MQGQEFVEQSGQDDDVVMKHVTIDMGFQEEPYRREDLKFIKNKGISLS